MGFGLICMAIVFAVFNLAFIIPDLIYAGQGSECVTTMPNGFSFNLSTWLRVDAYTRIAMVALLLLVGIASCISVTVGITCGVCLICFLAGYSAFSLAWTIVGAVMFWNRLNPTGVCQDGVQSYMFAMLIISFVGICCNCIYSLNSGKNRQNQQ